MGVDFLVIPSDFDEYLDHGRPAKEVAIELGVGKAKDISQKHPQALVIGSDTIVTLNGEQLGKPKDINQARQWLRDHAGLDIVVTTSVVLLCEESGLHEAAADETIVHFKPYSNSDNEAYLATNDWADKAGGWGIQSGAAPLIEYISGRYDTILGLPTHILAKMLQAQGIQASELILDPPVPQK